MNKKKKLRRPTNPMQTGLVHGEVCKSRTVLQKILSGLSVVGSGEESLFLSHTVFP